MVCQGDKAHRKSRESLLNQPPGFNIIPSQSGQVFYNHTVDMTRFYVFHHPLKLRPVKIRPGEAVIHIDIINLHVVLFSDKRADHIPLGTDAVAFCPAGSFGSTKPFFIVIDMFVPCIFGRNIIPAQPKINGGIIKFSPFHLWPPASQMSISFLLPKRAFPINLHQNLRPSSGKQYHAVIN